MSMFDTLAALLLSISLVFSLIRGMVREIFSLLAYIGGYFLAINYRESFSATLYEQIPNKTASEIISFGLIFIGSVIGISLVGKVMQNLVHSAPGLSGIDRLFGAVLGVAKGVVILIILMFPLKFFPELQSKITRDSYVAPHIKNFSAILARGIDKDKVLEKLPSIDLNGVKEKLSSLKDLEKSARDLTSKSVEAIKREEKPEESVGQPQDDYTKEDKNKLNELLLSVDKE